VWQRTTLVAKDDDPQRVNRLARIRWVFEHPKRCEAMVLADALASHLLPKVGCAWMPKGTQVAGMPPGHAPATRLGRGPRSGHWDTASQLGTAQNHRAVPGPARAPEVKDPAERYTRVYVVVATSKIHNAKAVEQWLAAHPWVTRLLLPTYCPQANPLERAFGDVHDLCPRNHMRRRLQELVADVAKHRHGHGPWLYKLADISYQPAVTTAVENMTAEEQSPWAA
jgi:hypothetical protein